MARAELMSGQITKPGCLEQLADPVSVEPAAARQRSTAEGFETFAAESVCR
ncbi:hypothetical protein ACE4RR_03110 [Alteribacillus sp. HJP-4]